MTALLNRLAAGIALLGLGAHASAINLGQVDTFQDGTVMSWSGGANPTNIATGGPTGAGDRFLQITANSPGGPGSRIGTWNDAQWGGNFALAGVTVIEVDMRNQGAVPLEMRLVLMGQVGTQWVSTDANVLPPDNVWRRVTFIMQSSHMTRTTGDETFEAVVGNVSRMMFRHDEGAPGTGGTFVNSQMGIDNIRALDAATVLPTSFARITGFHISGTLSDLLASDNSYVRARVSTAAELVLPITYEFTTTSPLGDPSQLKFTVESGADAPGRGEFISLFNYVENRWEFIQRRTLGSADSVTTATIGANAARFVHPLTRQTKARVTWYEAAAETVQILQIRIDHVFWQISP